MSEIKGIDVSRWNGNIDWKIVANYGMDFAILRITEKDNIIDSTFETNYKGCTENKIPVGVYKYSYATNVSQIKEEANIVIKTLKSRKLDYPVFLDIEDKCQENISKDDMLKMIKAFRSIVIKAGYKFGIYCGYSWFKNLLPEDAKKYDVWVARYPSNDTGDLQERLRVPASEGVIGWQYSSKATIPGILTKVDRNVFYIDYSKSSLSSSNNSSNTSDNSQGGNAMSKEIIKKIIDDAVSFAVAIANDNSHGYSQAVRSLFNITNPKSFDCSSLVITSFYYAFMKNGLTEQAEYLKTHCSYTGNMMYMTNCGFEVVARNQTAHASMVKGDIELNTTHHTALAIDKDNIVHARTSEGTSNTIDDSGNEIRVQGWYNYSHGWTHRLRFTGKGIDFSNIKPSNISIPSTKSYLSIGDAGSEVKSLQQKLNILGYKGADGKALTEDGSFGTNTVYAVKAFQKDAKIEIDGKAGKYTLNAINLKIEALQKPTEPSSSITSASTQLIKDAQIHLNNFTGSKLKIDGKYGAKTKKAFISAIQIALNKDYGYNFSCKGVWGDKTELALSKTVLKKGSKGYLVTVAEISMLLNNINPNGVECPGVMGDGLVAAVKQYQKNKGLVQDGIVGINTWKSLCK